ncbi:hypothetical protein BFW01_g2628 [Lasiodiplodia theobromae]|nr:hypothetical protein BFW01_g2628 [Lasiodiplodia theobromae]
MSSVAPPSGPFQPGTIFFHQPNGGSKCRKVVVEVRGDTLICLPVTTNGGNATKKLDRAGQSKHAIIYTGSKTPNRPRDEPHLRKSAIRATIARSPYVLNELSRVDYSTEVPVERTDELCHLGQVKSVGILLNEWKKVRGDTGSSAQKAATPETNDAASGHAPQSHPSSSLVGRSGTGPEAETDAQEQAPPPQQAVVRPECPPSCARTEQSVATLKPDEVMIKNRCWLRLSKNQKSKRSQPDTSSNEVSKLPRTVQQGNSPKRKSTSAVPTQQTQRSSPGAMVSVDILNETVKAAVSQAMAEQDSNKQKSASFEEVLKQTGIHSQFDGHYNVFQARPMFTGPPPPYDVMEFEEFSGPPVSHKRNEEPESITADRSSSDAPPPNVPPPAPMPPSSGIESPEQDDYEESRASEYHPEDEGQRIDPQMPNWKAQHPLNTYLKPRRIGTGRGPSSSQAESSHSGSQQQQERKYTVLLFVNSDWQQVFLTGRLDTGADANFISPRAAREIVHSYHKYRGGGFQVANGEVETPEWLIFTSWAIKNVDNTLWHDRFIVFNNLPCDVVIGKESIKKNDILHPNPKYGEFFMLQSTSPRDKKGKAKQEEERRRRYEHNRQKAAQQNKQTREELEQEYAYEMHAQQGYAGQNGQ